MPDPRHVVTAELQWPSSVYMVSVCAPALCALQLIEPTHYPRLPPRSHVSPAALLCTCRPACLPAILPACLRACRLPVACLPACDAYLPAVRKSLTFQDVLDKAGRPTEQLSTGQLQVSYRLRASESLAHASWCKYFAHSDALYTDTCRLCWQHRSCRPRLLWVH